MTVTDISVPGLNGIRQWEGRALRAYQDAVGVWTIGYGITNMDKGIGFVVKKGVTITVDQAEWLLYTSLRRNYMPDVERALQADKCAHPQGAFDAAMSFHYNTGGILRASWPKSLMAGALAAAKANLMIWNRAKGKVLAGLTSRREWEWNVTQGNYGHLMGPAVLNDRERIVGHGEFLTKMPTAPGSTAPGTIATGVPVAHTPAPGVLKIGITGPSVLALQRQLSSIGYPTAPTGTFDASTDTVVRKFQKTHPSLTVDGEVGPATEAAFTRAVAMRTQSGNAAKTILLGPLIAVGVHAFNDSLPAQWFLVGGVALTVVALAVVAWRFRGEVEAWVNKLVGRTVV